MRTDHSQVAYVLMDPAFLRVLVREGISDDAVMPRELSHAVLSGWRATLTAQWSAWTTRGGSVETTPPAL